MSQPHMLSPVESNAALIASVAAPRSAYIHVPFCARRCGYCNFTLVAGRLDLAGKYLDALELELALLGEPREVDTIFIGGGTPTLLAPADLERLLAVAVHWFKPARNHEFSVEANPADLTAPLLDQLVRAGVTRLSIGGQSFNDAKLLALDRDHRGCDVTSAVRLAQEYVASVSLDLIFGAPGESLADWRSDLSQAVGLAPQHISTYGLTFERGTMFWNRRRRGELSQLDEEVERDMYVAAIDGLIAAGYEHYEVSNFARAGHRCRHNEAYWAGDEYFGVGPGAASYIDGVRRINHRSTTTYIKRVLAGVSPVAESERLAPQERAREHLVFALRRMDGVDRAAFAVRTGFEIDRLVGGPLGELVSLGMLEDDGARLRLSREGLLVSDSIWPRFLAP